MIMKKTILIFAVVLMALSVSTVFAESDTVVQARQNFLKAQSDYDLARADWIAARQVYVNAVKANNTNATFPIEQSKAILEKLIDRVIAHIQVVKDRIQDAKILSDSEKANFSGELDADSASLSALKAEVQTITTKDQYKAVAEKIKLERQKDLKNIETVLGIIEAERGERIIDQAQNVSAKIEKYIDNLKSKGVDTSGIEGLLTEYRNDLSLASSSLADAKNKFAAGSNEDGRDALKAGKRYIIDANKALKEGVNMIKEAGKGIREQQRENRREMRNNISALKPLNKSR
ncbi:Uncharacterised protein [uncultured archaeon]|nr:Uncharacterised protein [uncultured archaeon]